VTLLRLGLPHTYEIGKGGLSFCMVGKKETIVLLLWLRSKPLLVSYKDPK